MSLTISFSLYVILVFPNNASYTGVKKTRSVLFCKRREEKKISTGNESIFHCWQLAREKGRRAEKMLERDLSFQRILLQLVVVVEHTLLFFFTGKKVGIIRGYLFSAGFFCRQTRPPKISEKSRERQQNLYMFFFRFF